MSDYHSLMRNWSDTWFMGVQCSQYAVDFVLWERLLNHNPDVDRIIELGTLWGGFSLFLFLQALQRNMTFITFDDGSYAVTQCKTDGPLAVDTPLGQRLDLTDHCVHGNVFDDCYEIVTSYLQGPGRCVLFCDDGNKPKEFATFAPLAKPGDIIVVHDWGTEILEQHIDYDLVDEIMAEVNELRSQIDELHLPE